MYQRLALFVVRVTITKSVLSLAKEIGFDPIDAGRFATPASPSRPRTLGRARARIDADSLGGARS